MTVLFPALAAAFGAFCVWLTARFINGRDRDLIPLAILAMVPVALWVGYFALLAFRGR